LKVAFAEAGAADGFLPIGSVAGGESQIVHQRGGRCVGIAGGFGLFHMIEDRWPHAVIRNQSRVLRPPSTTF
jgi:hypothetical protein